MTSLFFDIEKSSAETDVALVDATWTLPGGDSELSGFLKGTRHSVDCNVIKAAALPDRLKTAASVFGDAGLSGQSTYAVYDRAGLFSAPWIWWMLYSYGYAPKLVEGWSEEDTSFEASTGPTSFPVETDPSSKNATRDDVLVAIKNQNAQIIDARPPGRFSGDLAEPRPECRSGHIPGSLNVPFGSLKSPDRPRYFKDQKTLTALFEGAGVDLSKPIITTCGSGVTASGLAVCLLQAGAEDIKVYQGSWAEWGVDPSLPIETGA